MTELPIVRRLLEEGIAAGLHPGAVVHASVGGSIASELAVGEAQPGVPLSPDSIVLWMSSTKPVGAVATLQLVERGKLTLDDRVAEHIPEFAIGGKEAITVRHLLTHTGGFRRVDLRGVEFDWDETLRRICAAPLEKSWIAGETLGYHSLTSWYVLGELIRRIDGRPFEKYVRDEIFLPLGMRDSWVGVPIDQLDSYGNRIALTHETDRPGHPVHSYSSRQGVSACVPGGNGHGPARELARFYEMLRNEGTLDRVRILSPGSVQQMTDRQNAGRIDVTFRHTLDFGLGLILNSARYGPETVPYGYGPYASDSTFGHSGSQSSVAFCDPERRLVAAVVFTGMPGEAQHQRRVRAVLAGLYEDLGLVEAAK